MEETKIIQFDNMTSFEAMCILGIEDKNLKVLSECFAKKISFRDNKFIIQDCDEFVAKQIKQVLMALYELAKKNQPVTELDVTYACRLVLKSEEIHFDDFESYMIGRTLTGKAIAPKTKGQYSFVKAVEDNAIVFAIGPAGTGKTYLSACALNEAAKNKRKVAFVQCSRLSERISNYHIDSKTEVDRLMYADFVVFDDIGAEEVSEKYRSVLLSILDARMQNHLMTWFTSNEDYKTLLEHYIFSNKSEDKYEAMRIIERIQTLSKPIELIAEDRRILHLK